MKMKPVQDHTPQLTTWSLLKFGAVGMTISASFILALVVAAVA